MRRQFCHLLLVIPCVWLGAFAQAGGWPRLDGDVSGRIELRMLAGMPPLDWRVQVRPGEQAAWLQMDVTISGPGLTVRATASLPTDGSPGAWKVVDGHADLAVWARVAARAAEVAWPEDMEIAGTLQLAGAGSLKGMEPTGTLTATLQGGQARSVVQEWEASDVSLQGALTVGPTAIDLASLRLQVGVVQAMGLGAGTLVMAAEGRPDGRIEVMRAEGEIMGGRVALEPFMIDPADFRVSTTANLAGLGLGELALLLPETLAEAHGRVNGRIRLRWSVATGFEPGAGLLTVAPEIPASLRLAAAPGFLTAHLPERIQLVPAWLGPLARWFAPENPAFDNLRRIELGEQSLTIDQLRVELYPDGPDAARSAVVEVSARPPAGSLVELVTFTINLAGPLEQVLKLGMDERASVNFSPGK
jgi:hypothetical protein